MDSTRSQLIRLLQTKAEEYISGQYLSEHLGISRAGIWKHMKALEADGYKIDAIPRRGYRVAGLPDKMSGNTLKWGLETEWIGKKIVFESAIASTQTLAKELAAEGAEHGTAVVADQQISGRGTKGRAWHSPAGTGIWTSLVLRPQFPPRFAARLTLVAAVAVANALQQLNLTPQIKWPNDIYLNDKKAAGILTEMQAEQNDIQSVVIGIGLNVNQSAGDFPEEISSKATSLSIESGKTFERQKILHLIWQEFERLYALFCQDGFAQIRENWMTYGFKLNQRVQVHTGTKSYRAVFKGIGDEGELLVEDKDHKLQHLYSAEIDW